ncbi:SAM-dependent methyltransferase [alpha proteobacterium AAP81b]|nr:SAM-dependent methyltransferase [alpha proteobacterium AAP81b]
MTAIDTDRLNALVGKMLGDLGGAFSVPTTRIGFRLGLFDALHNHGPVSAADLAQHTGLAERYLREWLLAQAANGYITADASAMCFHLSPEQAMIFVARDSPVYLEGAFDLAAAMIEGEAKVEAGFRSGEGVQWGDSAGCLFCAVGAFFRPGYVNAIVPAWLPALGGMVPRLEAGARVADIGCGVGFSTLLMAQAFPNSHFTGYDFHGPSIEQANAHAAAHGLGERVRFEAVPAKAIATRDFDLVTMFDCLHDMGDPRGCAAHVHGLLKPDGAWMLVEPIAADSAADNLGNPVSRIYYNASTMICVPTSLAQEVGTALGAQAGEAQLTAILHDAGFSQVRRATEGPFNMVLEARH